MKMPRLLQVVSVMMALACGFVFTCAVKLLVSVPVGLSVIMILVFAGVVWLTAGFLADREIAWEERQDDGNDLP
jgi:hypothetical protein